LPPERIQYGDKVSAEPDGNDSVDGELAIQDGPVQKHDGVSSRSHQCDDGLQTELAGFCSKPVAVTKFGQNIRIKAGFSNGNRLGQGSFCYLRSLGG